MNYDTGEDKAMSLVMTENLLRLALKYHNELMDLDALLYGEPDLDFIDTIEGLGYTTYLGDGLLKVKELEDKDEYNK